MRQFFCVEQKEGQLRIFTGEWTAIQAMLPTQPYTVEQCISVG